MRFVQNFTSLASGLIETETEETGEKNTNHQIISRFQEQDQKINGISGLAPSLTPLLCCLSLDLGLCIHSYIYS